TFFLHRGVSSGRGPAQGVADQGGQASGIVGPGGLAQIRAGTVVGLFHGDVGQAEERPGVVGQCVGGVRPQGRDPVWSRGGGSARPVEDGTELFDSLGHRVPSSCGGGLRGSYRFFSDGGGGTDRGLAEQRPVGLFQTGQGLCFFVCDASVRNVMKDWSTCSPRVMSASCSGARSVVRPTTRPPTPRPTPTGTRTSPLR